MSKNKDSEIKIEDEKKKIKIFSNFIIPPKVESIKNRIKTSSSTMKKNHRILTTVEIGNDPNFKKYIKYLEGIRKKEQEEYLEYLRQKNRKDPLLVKLSIDRQITFPEFCDKFKINTYLIDYFDYYEIQKINKKKTAELIKKIKERIKKEKNKLNNKENAQIENIENIDKNYKYFKRRINLINPQKLKKEEKRLSMDNFKDKNSIKIEGIDFDLIKNIYPELEENDKKILNLYINNEIEQEKKNFYKNIYNKNTKTEPKFYSDKYTITHTLEKRSQRKLNRLKTLINKKKDKLDIDYVRPKTSKTLPNEEEKEIFYLNYIPNSSKYKHINFQKNLIFNNEFINNKNIKNKFRNKYNNIKTETDIFPEKKLLKKSSQVINNLNKIKSVLKQDKKYTSKTIERANTAFKRNEFINSEKRNFDKLMKDNNKGFNKYLEIKEKIKKKRKFNIFKDLKEMTKTAGKNTLEATDIFSKLLNSLCKEEKKEKKKYYKFANNNYYLKLNQLRENNGINEDAKENLEGIKKSYEILMLKIKKRYNEINNIMKNSKNLPKEF